MVVFAFDPISHSRPQTTTPASFLKADPTFLSIIYGAMLTGVDIIFSLTSDNLTAPAPLSLSLGLTHTCVTVHFVSH